MKKIINIILCLLILAAIIVLGVIIFRYYQYQKNSNEAVEVVAQIEKEFEEVTQTDAEQGNQKVEVEYKGYKVVGINLLTKVNSFLKNIFKMFLSIANSTLVLSA